MCPMEIFVWSSSSKVCVTLSTTKFCILLMLNRIVGIVSSKTKVASEINAILIDFFISLDFILQM